MVGIFLRKIERRNACGRKGSIRDLQPGRQLHRCGTDRIHRDRNQLRHAGSTPRHSSDQPKLFLQKAPDRAKDHNAEVGAYRGRAERAVEDGVVILVDGLLICFSIIHIKRGCSVWLSI